LEEAMDDGGGGGGGGDCSSLIAHRVIRYKVDMQNVGRYSVQYCVVYL
jgi:hypothetical protein